MGLFRMVLFVCDDHAVSLAPARLEDLRVAFLEFSVHYIKSLKATAGSHVESKLHPEAADLTEKEHHRESLEQLLQKQHNYDVYMRTLKDWDSPVVRPSSVLSRLFGRVLSGSFDEDEVIRYESIPMTPPAWMAKDGMKLTGLFWLLRCDTETTFSPGQCTDIADTFDILHPYLQAPAVEQELSTSNEQSHLTGDVDVELSQRVALNKLIDVFKYAALNHKTVDLRSSSPPRT
eukprot:GILJ01008731.1.p1 GENE.GILJ01008731.1~~GILJ01008731.1.p1  ORF type:complete len:233 (-),score=26.14 GILJ01008731.1:51-749(-)